MKVFEILRNDTPAVTEQQIIDRLKAFDWKYEFSEDTRKVQKGEKELEILENMVYSLWKTNPEKAIQIWNENAPGFKGQMTIVPSFLFRLQQQEK
jgi:hypothetical protein